MSSTPPPVPAVMVPLLEAPLLMLHLTQAFKDNVNPLFVFNAIRRYAGTSLTPRAIALIFRDMIESCEDQTRRKEIMKGIPSIFNAILPAEHRPAVVKETNQILKNCW